MSQLLIRAGGLKERAFSEGAIFLRESVKERELQQIEMLTVHLEADLSTMSLAANSSSGEALSTGQALLDQLRNAEPVGRFVIDVAQLTSPVEHGSDVIDLELKDGDRLLVPSTSREVTVIGEAQQPTPHLYRPGLSRDDYINRSGGLTRRADKRQIYVVRASGAVIAPNHSRWFGGRSATRMKPGDTIVVPIEIDRIRPLELWGSVTQILYQGARSLWLQFSHSTR